MTTELSTVVAHPNFQQLKTKEAKFDYLVDNGIKSAVAREYLANTGVKKVDQMPLLVTIFREASDRKSALARAKSETEYSESTANHFYNAISFAKEWHKQEVEEHHKADEEVKTAKTKKSKSE